ncbi:MAG: hypothetical protein OSJ72_20950 [Lachnospiraceae bacterium]|nr:hypothetical protein [Lachnospiraceae bacterium]MCX4342075.1 hypothetical protein [Lachnospiraceae bacterium]
MDLIFLLAVLFIIGCFIWRKKLAVFFHTKKQPSKELPMQPEERPVVVTYKVLAYNARDYGNTKDLENAMELRLEQCLAGLAKQRVTYDVSFYATGYVMVYLVKYWY